MQTGHMDSKIRFLPFSGKTYEVDEDNFLLNPKQWDEDFAVGLAPMEDISEGLTQSHWKILKFIRHVYQTENRCPTIYSTCKEHKLRAADMAKLFPTGYRRGACKLAGMPYLVEDLIVACPAPSKQAAVVEHYRVYRVNAAGFLVDPSEWDEDFAAHKAAEIKMPFPLSEKQCMIIHYLRGKFSQTGKVPTFYQTCEDNGIDIDELGELFPDGYHRGAVKIAGLQ